MHLRSNIQQQQKRAERERERKKLKHGAAKWCLLRLGIFEAKFSMANVGLYLLLCFFVYLFI